MYNLRSTTRRVYFNRLSYISVTHKTTSAKWAIINIKNFILQKGVTVGAKRITCDCFETISRIFVTSPSNIFGCSRIHVAVEDQISWIVWKLHAACLAVTRIKSSRNRPTGLDEWVHKFTDLPALRAALPNVQKFL